MNLLTKCKLIVKEKIIMDGTFKGQFSQFYEI